MIMLSYSVFPQVEIPLPAFLRETEDNDLVDDLLGGVSLARYP